MSKWRGGCERRITSAVTSTSRRCRTLRHSCLAAAGRYADRVSVNIELPTPADLHRLAPDKSQPAIVGAMTRLKDAIDESKTASRSRHKAPVFAPAGQSTQMIIGATPTTDTSILQTASELYTRQRLRRVYYSAYSPIPQSHSFLPAAAAPLVREHRLYQADWLLRFYGFRVDELTTTEEPNLDMRVDPKTAWAVRHPEQFPVDVNVAPREMLLRTPGLGQRSVERMLRARRLHRLSLKDLQTLRIRLGLARPFIITSDWRPSAVASAIEPEPRQPLLWSA